MLVPGASMEVFLGGRAPALPAPLAGGKLARLVQTEPGWWGGWVEVGITNAINPGRPGLGLTPGHGAHLW